MGDNSLNFRTVTSKYVLYKIFCDFTYIVVELSMQSVKID